MDLLDFIPIKLSRNAVGPILTSKIRGNSEVAHLRRLMAAPATEADCAAALAWTIEAMKNACYQAASDDDAGYIAIVNEIFALRRSLWNIQDKLRHIAPGTSGAAWSAGVLRA